MHHLYNASMIRLRAITWAMGIWATAVSTLLAGMPHLQCRCPDGRIKPFCLSILFASTCCDRACCIDAAGSQSGHEIQPSPSKKSCCCCQASQRPERGEQIRPRECQKTIVKASIASPSDSVRSSAHDFASPLLDAFGSIPFGNAQSEFGRFTASFPWSFPSTDRVIALRHLLI